MPLASLSPLSLASLADRGAADLDGIVWLTYQSALSGMPRAARSAYCTDPGGGTPGRPWTWQTVAGGSPAPTRAAPAEGRGCPARDTSPPRQYAEPKARRSSPCPTAEVPVLLVVHPRRERKDTDPPPPPLPGAGHLHGVNRAVERLVTCRLSHVRLEPSKGS